MKKIVFCLFFITSNYLFPFDFEGVDKDNMQNLINGVTSVRASGDLLQAIYDFTPMLDSGVPLNLGVSILDLSTFANNTMLDDSGNEYTSFVPKAFVGVSFYSFALGYQFSIDNPGLLGGGINSVANSHSLAFSMATQDFYFSVPFSVATGDTKFFPGKLALSTTPTFTFIFRAGYVREFEILAHYGISFPDSTNSVSAITPMSVGLGIKADVILTDFESSSLQITFPLQFNFRYGIKSRIADIDAGYAGELINSTMYDESGELSTDSIYFGLILPVKLEAKLGVIYVYGMPRILSEVFIYKTDTLYSVGYGMEAGFEFTLIENLTLGFKGYVGGASITREDEQLGFNNSFDGDLDIWGVWRF